MPVCPRCRIAFLDGEVHRCTRPSRRATVVWGALAALYVITYSVMSYEDGRLVNPAVVVVYLPVLFGLLMTGLVHLLLTICRVTG